MSCENDNEDAQWKRAANINSEVKNEKQIKPGRSILYPHNFDCRHHDCDQ
jgi:hypothetical protein